LQKIVQEALQKGAELFQQGLLAEAETLCRKIFETAPGCPDANHLLGMIERKAGRSEQAVKWFSMAIQENPDVAAYHGNLGNAFRDLGCLEDAVESYQKTLSLKPDFLEAHSNLGVALKELGRLDEAVASFRAALAIKPDYFKAHINLGNALLKMMLYEDAEASYRAALAVRPDSCNAHLWLANALRRQNRHEDAVASCRAALALAPERAEAHSSLGTAFREMGRLDDAVDSYQRALSLDQDNTGAHSNLGVALADMGRLEDAAASHLKALEIDPGNAEARYNLGLLHLMAGRFREGWTGYALRWYLDEYADKPEFPQAPWDGSTLAGKSILVWAEQGIGDEIMFAGMIPDLIETGARVTLECDHRLVPLYQRSFPGIECVPRAAPPVRETRRDDIDFQMPVGDFCGWFREDLASFPARSGFLKADSARTAELRARYQERFPDKHIIGLSWRGGSQLMGAGRSIPLADWLAILSHPRCAFVSLQYGDVEEELDDLRRDHGIDILRDPDVDPFRDIDGLASQIAAMDSVFSIANITLQLAGALGVPTWALLMKTPDWRWMLDRDDSPWYPSVKLFRQEARNDWVGVIERIAKALNERFKN
jgi:tetratricopeptide (TPR) repeat protein